ncbi:hypothetical protein MBM_03225 [Drepanopeziza brunnea f. sp. 'multigermtubi' MB_m1]|uniref:Uncharacterized protein n=1 Tax=Marssonina brunnea f. sp. multigermtubi (strain MB_m1) TaxID=1072389 RepID=K1WZY0_MARBU|nr:uncharacterized protein MBM_03225 [Drepanopeziza brunnea f. sp. 'multigermtubi' MB_m1]EKD18232.1 hypothetical protein MBM_03225 [Drepanopeziza brunnea f. sp. 'multigermtubi' MB_m1]
MRPAVVPGDALSCLLDVPDFLDVFDILGDAPSCVPPNCNSSSYVLDVLSILDVLDVLDVLNVLDVPDVLSVPGVLEKDVPVLPLTTSIWIERCSPYELFEKLEFREADGQVIPSNAWMLRAKLKILIEILLLLAKMLSQLIPTTPADYRYRIAVLIGMRAVPLDRDFRAFTQAA